MSQFNFKGLVAKFAITPVYYAKEEPGYYDYDNMGVWVPGQMTWEQVEKAAAIPISDRDLKYDTGGTYTTEDYKLYAYVDLKDGLKMKFKGRLYTLKKTRDYSDYDDGLRIYMMKRGDIQ